MNDYKTNQTDMPDFFYSAGIYRHHVAGQIFMEAVFMAAQDMSRLKNISRNIYEPLARRRHTTAGAVSKNIRDVRSPIMRRRRSSGRNDRIQALACPDSLSL